MPLFSLKRSNSSSSLSDSSAPSSLPLTNTVEEGNQENSKKKKSFVEKFLSSGVRHGRRSRSPIHRNQASRSPGVRRSKSPVCTPDPFPRRRSYSPPKQERPKPVSRMGKTFCSCCDMRIAVILLNILHMAIAISIEIVEARKWGNRNYSKEPPVLLLLAIGISSLGMYGALNFSMTPLVLSSISLCFLSYVYLVEYYLFSIVLAIMILSVQIIFADEIRRGVMSRETYEREEYMDKKGRKVIEKVHCLSIDIGETASEFAEEVKRKASGAPEPVRHQKVDGC